MAEEHRRLGSARAAARTGVLSHRWRRVFARLPELVLDSGPDAPPPPASFLDTVDGALAAYSSSPPALGRLCIALHTAIDLIVPAGSAAPWLRFAADRVACDLCLIVPPRTLPGRDQEVDVEDGEDLELPAQEVHVEEREELELPAWSGAKTITLSLQDAWRLRPPPAGSFTALTGLTILYGRMEGRELTDLVCTQCPCLRDLRLCLTLVDASDVSIRSDSLRSLWLCIWNSWRLEVIAPRLEKLSVCYAIQARISAPKLAELVWYGRAHDPYHHQFDDDVSRHLRLLEMDHYCMSASLMLQFDEVDELKLHINIIGGTAGYESFLNETNKLPKCKTLNISSLMWNSHGLAPSMLHLLRSCDSTKKVSARLIALCEDSLGRSCPSSCPCRLAENNKIDDIALSSLEEVEISSFTASPGELEFVEWLSRCNTTSLKKLVINYGKKRFHAPLETKEVCEKIHNMYQPNVDVKFYVVRCGRPVRFDWRVVKKCNVMVLCQLAWY